MQRTRNKNISIKELLEYINELLKHYRNFKQELWSIEKRYEETREIDSLINKIAGKIELLEELKSKYESD